MRRFTVLALLALPLAGCAAADAAVVPETADEVVAAQLSSVQDWQANWADTGCATAASWDPACGIQMPEAGFTASEVYSSFDRTLYPGAIDGLTTDQRHALIPAIDTADETLRETKRWQHISCPDSPAATARHMETSPVNTV